MFFCLCNEVQILSYLLMHVHLRTRFNLIAAKLRCSCRTLSLIAKMKKKSTCTNIFESSYIYSVHQRYDFVSEVGKIVLNKEKVFFINKRNWSSGWCHSNHSVIFCNVTFFFILFHLVREIVIEQIFMNDFYYHKPLIH